MFKKWVISGVMVFFAALLSGCATANKQAGLENQGLRNQITVLESQIQSKDLEINSLKEALQKLEEATPAQEITKRGTKRRSVMIGEIKSRLNARQIQIALKNAGFDPGLIDGKIGSQTRDAIRAFQRANNLALTGRADKATRRLLKEYLYKKVK